MAISRGTVRSLAKPASPANAIPLIEKTKDLFLTTSSSCLNHSDSNLDTNSLMEELNHPITYRLAGSCVFKHLFSNLDFGAALVKE